MLVLLILALYLLIVRIIYKKVFGKKKTLKRIEDKAGLIDLYKIDLCFWEKYKFEELTLVNDDGLKLKSHFYDREGADKIAVVVHGYGSDYREMSNYSKMFVDMGYSVLVPENRAHGKSEGSMVGLGYYDRFDILAWIKVLSEKYKSSKIVLFGLSMGATAVCNTVGEDLPSNVVCAISDCAFENVYNQFEYVFNPKQIKLRKKLLEMFNNYMIRAYNFDLKKADTGVSLKKSKIPVMFVHGKEDSYVPVENVYKLASKLGEHKKDVYIVENAGHAMCYPVNPRRYEFRVREFLKKWGV